jgi:hypothetical protein
MFHPGTLDDISQMDVEQIIFLFYLFGAILYLFIYGLDHCSFPFVEVTTRVGRKHFSYGEV